MTTNATTPETLAKARAPRRVAGLGIDRSPGGLVMDKETWYRAVLTLQGWRRYMRKGNYARVRKIVERNQREAKSGAVPLPPIEPEALHCTAREYCGRNFVDPDMLDWATVEAYLASTELPVRFRGWLKIRPKSELMNRAWKSQYALYAEELEAMFAVIGVPYDGH